MNTMPTPADGYAPQERRNLYLDDPRRKREVLAVLLSLMPGLGQVYVGYYRHGFAYVATVASLIALLSGGHMHRLEPALGMFLAFFWLYNLVDAYRRASLYNQALSGLRPMDLPEDQMNAPWRGSFAGGTALVLIGLVAFANTMFGVSLEWLERWWPMAVVALGVWLIYNAIQTRQIGELVASAPSRSEPPVE